MQQAFLFEPAKVEPANVDLPQDCAAAVPPPTVVLSAEDDWAGFLAGVTSALAAGHQAEAVEWRIGGLASPDAPARAAGAARPNPLPAAVEAVAKTALLHADPARFVPLHRLLARVAQDRRAALDTLDPDRITVEALARQVRRDMHKMKAFVRFRPVTDDDGERFVAWFEPANHVVRAVAPFFARRFAQMRWAILTPRGSVHWQEGRLRFGPAADRGQAPAADAGEALWLDYYRSIFNPARVKLAMMRREMPVRYWRNLPEAHAIPALVAAAGGRVDGMNRSVDSSRDRRAGRSGPGHAANLACPDLPDAGLADTALPLAPQDRVARLQTLQRRASRCDRCVFACAATQTVWGEGSVDASLMLVGEQPGDREDLEGRPFVGPAGQLLKDQITRRGWPTDRLYLTNAVKHFRYEWRGKRRMHKTASQREAAECADWLEQEIALVNPAAIVALGATAARSLLDASRPGSGAISPGWHERPDGRRVLVCAHPAAVLRGHVPLAQFEAQLALADEPLAEAKLADAP